MARIMTLGLFFLLLTPGYAKGQTVSLGSLLDEMTNRDTVARLPKPAYTCRQFSSYDRDSVAPDQPGWFANRDRSQFVRIEENDGRKEYVLMDTDGPGAVVRFWATWHGPRGEKGLKEFTNGMLRVYLDNQQPPAIEGPIADIIDGGGLVGPPLSEGVSPETEYGRRGHNLYLPIPYARHCKITYETSAPMDRGAVRGEALYYQINFRTYAQGTSVTSFSLDQLEGLETNVDDVQKRLMESGTANEGLVTAASDWTLAPGESETLTLTGPAAIRELNLNIEADDQAQALRSTILEIEFDGETTVWCPVGALSGIGYQARSYRSWYTEVTDNGDMSCYWVMPFARSCRLSLHNLGGQEIRVVRGEARYGPWQWDDRSTHFHATWRQLTRVDTKGRKDMAGGGAFDVNYVLAKGQGTFVGDTLTLFNGTGAWWGEGDEKIYVDGESFPSHFGTGTEDYYGYAWCRPERFSSPFHSQPCGDGNLAPGFSVNSRYRALDAIPFTESIQFDMELWHWRGTKMNYAPATFWYARPGATCNVQPDPATATESVALKRTDVVEVFHVPGVLEGESLKVVEITGGTKVVQSGAQFGWSADEQIWWRDGKIGDRLVLEFPAAADGRVRIAANLTKAVDYAIVKIAINDYPPKEFDRFHTSVENDKLELGTFDLKQGGNRLTVEICGANEKAIKRHMFGLDYLQLIPAP